MKSKLLITLLLYFFLLISSTIISAKCITTTDSDGDTVEICCDDSTWSNPCKVATDEYACINNDQDCSERCCVGGGCNSWDDFWFCNKGSISNCDVDSPYQNNMVCCPSDYPIWNEDSQECWKSGWECTKDNHCDFNERCSGNKCELKEGYCNDLFDCSFITETYNQCNGDYLEEITKETVCKDNKCDFETTATVLEYCEYGCENTVCIVKECDEGELKCSGNDLLVCQNNEFVLKETCENGCEEGKCLGKNWFLYISIGAIVIFIFSIIFLIFRKKKKWKKY